MKKILLKLLLSIIFITSVYSFDMTPINIEEGYAVVFTDDGSSLRMRESPKTGAPVVSIPNGHLVLIGRQRTKGKDTIDGISDYWYRASCDIEPNYYSGWVFGGYLTKILNEMPYEVYTQYKYCWNISYANVIKQDPYEAILNGDDNEVSALFAFGILKADKMYESMDKKEKEYPAALAVRRELPAVLKTLLQNGATVNQSNSDDNILFLCARKFDSEFIKTCLRYAKVDVNYIDKNGHTALWEAVKNQNYETTRVLLQYGADPNIGAERPFEIAKDDMWFTNLLTEYKEIYEQNQKGFSMKTRLWSEVESPRVYKKDFTLTAIVEYDKDGLLTYRFLAKNYDTLLQEIFTNATDYRNKYQSSNREEVVSEGKVKKTPVVNFNDVENRWQNSWSNWETIKNDKGQIIKFVRDDNLMQQMGYDEKGNILWVDGWGFDEYYDNEYYDNGQLKRISKYSYGYNTGDL